MAPVAPPAPTPMTERLGDGNMSIPANFSAGDMAGCLLIYDTESLSCESGIRPDVS